MELFIAGGCGEHGRNCFYVQGETVCFLVDCGAMAGEPGDPNPRLSQDQINRLNAVFLTHSHADHTGALRWLLQRGYQGPIVATEETLRQLPWELPNKIPLENVCPQGAGRFLSLSVTWGRSGHCAGSVWYRFEENGIAILFSGDYTEDAKVYVCDPIRDQQANLAVLDCAYGRDETTYDTCRERLLCRTEELLDKNGLVLFPVPKFGRGLELLKLLGDRVNANKFYADALFLQNLATAKAGGYWFGFAVPEANVSPYENQCWGIVFVSDPQLRTEAARETAKYILSSGGKAIMTGTVERGSFSETLIQSGNMELIRFPVHLNYHQYQKLVMENDFLQAIPYHSSQLAVPATIRI